MNFTPDPQLHLYISVIKSGLRIAAGIALFCIMLKSAAVLFILAEVLGIIEELV